MSDDMVAFLFLSPCILIGVVGILILIYLNLRKPQYHSTKTKDPQKYINHYPSKKLGGEKTSVRRPH